MREMWLDLWALVLVPRFVHRISLLSTGSLHTLCTPPDSGCHSLHTPIFNRRLSPSQSPTWVWCRWSQQAGRHHPLRMRLSRLVPPPGLLRAPSRSSECHPTPHPMVLVTYDFTSHLRVRDRTTWFWRCLGAAFGHFLLGPHNFMLTALGSCVKWP